jgi:eukaryotic-like serine/threonine-protein kinase
MTPDRIGRYEIVEELGHGAMGIVYKARDPLLDRTLALKTLSVDIAGDDFESFERRFYREARSAGRLSHPNIVTVHDVGKCEAVAYIAMEYLQGRSLREMLDLGVVFPPDRIADIGAQVADGLAFAHENGVVHRDIKPANIMVLDKGAIKITDFGIAQLPAGSATVTGNVFGSPKYMAPELIVGHPVDGRADIFSLGAVLYEMLTGFAPFFGGDLDTVLYQVINEIPAAPSSRNKSVAVAFDYIVAKAMAKHPDDRYPSARAIAADLRKFRLLAPLSPAPPERTLERRAIRRRKGDRPPESPRATTPPAAARAQRRKLIVYGASAVLAIIGGAWVASRFLHRADPVAAAPKAKAEFTISTAASAPASTDAEPKAPESEVSPQRPVSTATTAPSRPAPAIAKRTPAAAKATARLTLAVTPWGEVYVDGRKKGFSPPLSELRLAPGKHRIEIRNASFQPYAETVLVEADTRLKIKHKFR